MAVSPIVAAIRHLLPEEFKTVNAFDDAVIVEKIARFKLNLSIISSPKTPTLKEKLYKTQKGVCSMCNKIIDSEYIHNNSVHIHHIDPIKKGGNKFAYKNLTIVHS